jgi:transglutaminase-like putative cysteine protease
MDEQKTRHEYNLTSWWDPMTAILYTVVILIVAARLSATGWVRNLDLVQTVVLLGGILGLALGRSIFSKLIVIILSFLYGIFVVPWQLGSTLGIDIEWMDRLTIMSDRIQTIIRAIIFREPVTDNLFFLLVMAVLFWILAVYSGYQLVRNGDVWRAVIPGGLAIIIIQNYDPILARRTWYLAFYILFSLILLARSHYKRQRRKWETSRTSVPPDAGFDFIRYAMLASVIIVLVAWNSPAMANTFSPISSLYRIAEEPWEKAKEELSFLFASLRATIGLVSDYYDEEQALGRGNVNDDVMVMRVVAPRISYPGHRYYWRARIYDNYENGSWSATPSEESQFNPNEGNFVEIDDEINFTVVDVEITPQRSIITLFTPIQPMWVSRPSTIKANLVEDNVLDVVNLEAQTYLRPEDTYNARAAIATVTEKQLREAGTEYPQWVLDRYLQVPEEVTARTRLLAGDLAEGADNPYDIALIMTAWLRDNIEYVELIDEPPANRELIDWFLFDYQKGFCNYYSTSMIIMLRTLGIPARWAVGYAQGEPLNVETPGMPEQLRDQVPDFFFETHTTYRVRQANAHSWPEVYFPEIGWIEFEPTVSQAQLFRPSGEDIRNAGQADPFNPFNRLEDLPQADDFRDAGVDSELPAVETRSPFVLIFGITAIILGLGIGLVAIVSRRFPTAVRGYVDRFTEGVQTPLPVHLANSLSRLGINPPAFLARRVIEANLPGVSRAFLEVNNALNRLKAPPESSATPSERVVSLGRQLPSSKEAGGILLEQYHRQIYSQHKPDDRAAIKAGELIRRLSYRLWYERIKNRILHPFSR